jgi:hypothetical protein
VLTFLVLMLQEADLLTVVIPDTVSALIIMGLTFYAPPGKHRPDSAAARRISSRCRPKTNKKEEKP